MAPYLPPLVFTVHGIRTRGEWQKRVSDLLGGRKIPSKSIDYGYYPLLRFVYPPSNGRMVDRFYSDYCNAIARKDNKVRTDDYRRRPSVVAHSFGTFMVGYSMLKYPDMKFDKVILCGSVLPVDFDWATLMQRDQVFCVRNEFGLKDPWTRVVGRFVSETGSSGARGFAFQSVDVVQDRYERFSHSDFFAERHVLDTWMPFLSQEPSPLQIVHGRNVGNLDRFGEMLDSSRNLIDAESFGGMDGYEEAALPPERSRTWIEIEEDIYTFLVDRTAPGAAKGYINAMPLVPATFELVKQGKKLDNQIFDHDLAPFSDGDVLLYLMSVGVAKDLRKQNGGLLNRPVEKLLGGLVDKLVHQRLTHGARVREIAGVGWTTAGRKLCEWMGMQEIARDAIGHPVFWADLTSREWIEKASKRHALRRLLRVYAEE